MNSKIITYGLLALAVLGALLVIGVIIKHLLFFVFIAIIVVAAVYVVKRGHKTGAR